MLAVMEAVLMPSRWMPSLPIEVEVLLNVLPVTLNDERFPLEF